MVPEKEIFHHFSQLVARERGRCFSFELGSASYDKLFFTWTNL